MWSDAQIRLTTRIIQSAFVCELIFALFYYFIPVIQMMIYGGIWWNFVGYNLVIVLLAVSVFVYFGLIHPDSWLAPVFAILLGAALVVETYSEYLKELEVLMAFLEIGIVLLLFSIIIIYVLLTALIHWGLLLHYDIQQFRNKKRERPHVTKKQVVLNLIALGLIISSASVVGVTLAEHDMVTGTITIQPSAQPMELAFWAQLNPDRYTETQRIALNKHNVLLIPYDTPRWYQESDWGRTQFVTWCNYWKTNYPNVRIMAVAHGLPGGFVWDGSAEGSIAFCHRILDTCIAENLTNVIGINTDQEKPQDLDPELIYKDRERNAQATVLWNQFFEDVEASYPGRFEFQTTFGMSSATDQLDGDNDLDVYVWNNVFTVPGWDEYAPMIYTADGANYLSEPISADKAHFELYLNMQILYDVLERIGTPEKIGVYIGITNMSIMGANNQVYWHNRPTATGYDALVTQALIAKHFGCRRLTTFILDTVPSDKPGRLMGGVFESYGDDFLDRYNESINGVESTTPFEILSYASDRRVGDLSKDLVFTPGVGISMAIAVVVVYCVVLMVQHKIFRKNTLNNAELIKP
jgi:hypothetical protein